MAKKRLSQKSKSMLGETLRAYESNRFEFLRDANRNLMRQLTAAKARVSELSESVFRAATEAAAALDYGPVVAPKVRRRGTAETALICVSDVQLGKKTESYDSAVTAQRMALYAEKIARLTALQRNDHPVREARVYLLGDIVEGELIFPAQPHMIDASLYKQVMLDGPRIIGDFLRTLLTVFERVHVVCVAGNHGRYNRFANPTTNADRMLYRFLAELFAKESRISFHVPDVEASTNWYVVDYPIGKVYGIMLFHGDQIRGGFAGFPFYGLAKKVWGWRAGAVESPFCYTICGHWHTPTRVTLNDVTAWVNGSVESGNAYAAENMASQGSPTQLLMFGHPKYGVTAEYWVKLDGGRQR